MDLQELLEISANDGIVARMSTEEYFEAVGEDDADYEYLKGIPGEVEVRVSVTFFLGPDGGITDEL